MLAHWNIKENDKKRVLHHPQMTPTRGTAVHPSSIPWVASATWHPVRQKKIFTTSACLDAYVEPEANEMMWVMSFWKIYLNPPHNFYLEAPKSSYIYQIQPTPLWRPDKEKRPGKNEHGHPSENDVDVTYPNNGKGNSSSQLPLDVMGSCLFLPSPISRDIQG